MPAMLLLFLILAVTEFSVMQLLSSLAIESRYFWLETFIDASAVAIVAALTVKLIQTRKRIFPERFRNSDALLFQVALVVFGIESLMMLLLPLINLDHSSTLTCLLDAFVFASLSTLIIRRCLLSRTSRSENNRKSWQQVKTQTKNSLLALYLFSLCLFMLFLMNVYQQQYRIYETHLIDRESQQLGLIRDELNRQVTQVTLDVQVLSRQQHLMAALNGNEFSFFELSQDYLNLALIKPNYEQIRFIDNQGNEQIRIERNQLSPYITPTSDLQNKAGRYYFDETMRLSQGYVYISPLDLNMEHGRIELPFKPIIRSASPVFDDNGNKRGITVINLNASPLLNHLQHADEAISGELMLLNDQGYWLFGEKRAAAWAFMFPQYQDRTVEKLYPGIWQGVQADHSGTLDTEYGYFLYSTIETGAGFQPDKLFPEQWPTWKLVIRIRHEQITNELAEIALLMVIFFILVASVTGVGTLLYSRAKVKNLQAQEEIHHLAHHDSLTGLCNRRLFIEMLELEIAHARRDKAGLAVIYLDLDRFKPINDQYGHEAGDFVLQEVSERLRGVLRESDTLSRIGGDEFAAILPAPGSHAQLQSVAERILNALGKPIIFRDQPLNIGISIGIARHFIGQPPESLMHEADQAMYRSKQAGRNCFHFASTAAI